MCDPEIKCITPKKADQLKLVYLSRHIIANFEKTLGESYAREWVEKLAKQDKFEALCACHYLDPQHRAMLASSLGLSVGDLNTAIEVTAKL